MRTGLQQMENAASQASARQPWTRGGALEAAKESVLCDGLKISSMGKTNPCTQGQSTSSLTLDKRLSLLALSLLIFTMGTIISACMAIGRILRANLDTMATVYVSLLHLLSWMRSVADKYK